MKRELNTGWEFRQAGSDSWQSATVPGVVHTDLLRNNKIEDPFFRTNEWDLQWIDKKDWEYRTEILLSADDLKYNRIEAVFEGLDTYAEVYINKEKVLDADNMFRTWTVNLKEVLTEGRNEIYLNFRSPITEDLPKLERLGYDLPAANDQSELGGLDEKRLSVFARKAGYHYGWDWGPRFVTMGIWRPVKLHFWNELKLEDVRIRLKSLENDKAVLGITAEIHALKSGDYDFQISSDDGNSGKTEKRFSVKEGPQVLSFDFQVDDPQLWWCNGLGDPYCYQINFAVSKNTQVLAEKTTTYGIRTIELVREKDSEGDGTSFYFKLNGIPVFAKGANYIPNDSFLPEVTDNRYRQVVDAAVDANMNMLRIWGGGIYESDLFYDLCDQAGIMIWQDFMFACSLYPGDEDFLNNIAHEVTDNVKRLRNHPCIVLWCGNNEIDIAWSHDTQGGWGWKEEYTPDQQKVLWNDYKKLFHELIPGKLAEMDEDRPYWPSSPQAGPDERSSNDAVSGDIHYWGVWHGQEPLENYNVHIGRFMSEFGLQSFPELETVKSYTIQEDWDIYSEVMQAHQKNKRKNGNAMISHYLLQHYREPKDFASFLYVNQVLQAKAIKTALEAHRRKKPYCMGSLYWQLNDCWPVSSWSSLDYYVRWKAAHYAARDAFEPLLISVEQNQDELFIHLVSDLINPVNGDLTLKLCRFTGETLSEIINPISVSANSSGIVFSTRIKNLLKTYDPGSVYLAVSLKSDIEERTILHYFKEVKDLKFSQTTIEYSIRGQGIQDGVIELKSDVLAKNVLLAFDNVGAHFSDNYFDLKPGELKSITYHSDREIDNIQDSLQIRSIRDTYNERD